MIEKWAFAGKKSTSNFKGFYMPVFLFQLFFLFDVGLHEAAAGLNDETHFCGDAEVRDDEELQLLQEGLTG